MIEYKGVQYKVFDAHTHWSKLMSKTLRPVLELLSTNEILDFAYSNWKSVKQRSQSRQDLKINMCVELMNFYGIDKLICLPIFPFDIPFSIQCEAKYPDRIIGFGNCNPRAKPEKLENTFDFLKQSKVKGIKLHAQFNKFNVKLHAKEVDHVLEFLEQNKIIALFHTGSHFDICDLTPLAKKHDNLKVILGHSGLAPQSDQAIACAIECPNVFLELSGQPYKYMMEHAIKHKDIGVERVLYGSDLPSLDPTVEMTKVLSLNVSEEDKRLILWQNTYNLIYKVN